MKHASRLRQRYGRGGHAYGDKRDYSKIELYYDGEYRSTTTQARTLTEAKSKFIAANPRIANASRVLVPIDPSKVEAFKPR